MAGESSSKRRRPVGEDEEMEVAVAVRQDNLLATAFHPELTEDAWWHRYFLSMVQHSSKRA